MCHSVATRPLLSTHITLIYEPHLLVIQHTTQLFFLFHTNEPPSCSQSYTHSLFSLSWTNACNNFLRHLTEYLIIPICKCSSNTIVLQTQHFHLHQLQSYYLPLRPAGYLTVVTRRRFHRTDHTLYIVNNESSRDRVFGKTEEPMKKRNPSSKIFYPCGTGLLRVFSRILSHPNNFYLLLSYSCVLFSASLHTHKHTNTTPRGPTTKAGTSKLFLRFTHENEPTRNKVRQVIAIKHHVPALGIRRVNSGYNVLFETKADTEKIMESSATDNLKKLNLAI